MGGKSLLIVEDDEVLNGLIVRQLRDIGYAAEGRTTWHEARAYLESHEPSLVLLDVRLPDANGLELLPELISQQPVIVLTAFASIHDAVEAMKAGAAEYLTKPVNLAELELTVERTLENAALRQSYRFYRDQLLGKVRSSMVGRSAALRLVHRLVNAVAVEDTTVLIQGESGVGKELVAREIHRRSRRSEEKFVTLDCCTLQENLFESELFGHERGAFTGADKRKKGLVEEAEGGTVFLDEIGEIGPAIQAKLLRFIESRVFRRLGGTKDLSSNTRIIAATNRDLKALTDDGGFRSDLFYRLNGFVIEVPPLRDRREDIPSLVTHFLSNHGFSQRIQKTVPPDAMEVLLGYGWPGNIRELRNVIERAIILSGDASEIRPDHLGLGQRDARSQALVELSFDHEPTLEELKRSYIMDLLHRHSGRRKDVADALAVSERNIYRLLKKYHISD